jgi:hypothetical protein
MIWRIRIALLTSVVMASTLCTVRADEPLADDTKPADAPKKEAIAPPVAPAVRAPVAPVPAPDGCGAPAYRTVCVTEWVPEYYKTTQTVWKRECVQEKYTAYKTECIPETKTRTVTHYERVCETRPVTKTICEKVCVQEERTCMKTVWTCVPVTTYVCKTVDKGHWECKEVACEPGFFEKMKGRFHHKKDCCDPCAAACGGCGEACNTCAPATKTVKVWVSCKVTEQVPCTKMERKCEMVPTKQMVSVWKSIPKTVTCNETCWKCVPVCKTETYTCYTHRCVPYESVRTVSKCVPVCQEVTACRMVAKTVEKKVPVCETPCSNTCSACDTCCEKPRLRDRLSGWMAKHQKHDCGCDSGCSSCH